MMRLAAILVALALPVLGLAQDAAPARPVFLVARAKLEDPNFHDAVVLLAHRGPDGAFGVIVNHPTDVPLAKLFPDAKRLAGRDDRLFFGGPVMRRLAVFVFRSSARDEATPVLEGVQMSSNAQLLAKLLDRPKPTEGLRVYAGMAGWGAGQLEFEIEHGDWRSIPADAKSIFDAKPEALWPELYRRAFATMARSAGQDSAS
jgi:putative transcriptional regulator